MGPLLRVRDLTVEFALEGRVGRAVRGLDLDLYPGEVLGLVGESGSGKSVAAASLLRLIPSPPGRIVSGTAVFAGRDLLALPIEALRAVRGREIAMIFQEPMSALNPVVPIGPQLAEVLEVHEGVTGAAARARVIAALGRVGISDPERRFDALPHQLSGGMLQRAVIAMALLCGPRLLIADEATTALDVTIQAQVLHLLLDRRREEPDTAILLIAHDLALVAGTCDRVVVLYGGMVQESGPVDRLLGAPRHPYTRGLLACVPSAAGRGQPLQAIPGGVPSPFDLPIGCAFAARCPHADARCHAEVPALREVTPGHAVRCHLAEALP